MVPKLNNGSFLLLTVSSVFPQQASIAEILMNTAEISDQNPVPLSLSLLTEFARLYSITQSGLYVST